MRIDKKKIKCMGRTVPEEIGIPVFGDLKSPTKKEPSIPFAWAERGDSSTLYIVDTVFDVFVEVREPTPHEAIMIALAVQYNRIEIF